MLGKGPDAFRTISEVADDLDVPQHVLRFWETRFTPIKPLKRGGGRRYYRPDDVDLLKGIRQLLYGQGYTIRGVQRILKEDGLRFVQAIGRGEDSAPRPAEPEPYREPQPEPAAADAPGEAPGRDERDADPYAHVIIGKSGLSDADAERLRLALADLLECERILGSLGEG